MGGRVDARVGGGDADGAMLYCLQGCRRQPRLRLPHPPSWCSAAAAWVYMGRVAPAWPRCLQRVSGLEGAVLLAWGGR